MRDDIDIEEGLRRFHGDPGPEVKRSVLARFSRRFGNGGPVRDKTSFWRKPIPLYVATAGVIIAVGLSFLAGQRTASSQRSPEGLRDAVQTENAGSTREVKWEAAPNDLM